MRKGKNVLLKTFVNNKVIKTSFFDLHMWSFASTTSIIKDNFSAICLQLRQHKLIILHSVLHWKEMQVTLFNISRVEFANLSFLCGMMSFHGSPQNAVFKNRLTTFVI